MNQRLDVYEQITNAIVEPIDARCGQFEMPWHTSGVLPRNANTNRCYCGVNILVLWAAATRNGFQSNLWATYAQWSQLGAQIRKGSRSATVVFWKFYADDSEIEEADAEMDTPHSRCFVRAYVFNADQVKGFAATHPPTFQMIHRGSVIR